MEIKERFLEKIEISEDGCWEWIANKFGVTRTCIRYIDIGETWSHVVVEE